MGTACITIIVQMKIAWIIRIIILFYHQESADSGSVRSRKQSVYRLFNATSFTSTEMSQCGTPDPSATMMAESSRIVQKWMASPNSRQSTTININTYFHIITAERDNETVGNLTDTDVLNQLQVLNDSYRPFGFSFTLMGTTRTNNSGWYDFNFFAMSYVLRVGDASTLNVYFAEPYGLVGFASFPWFYKEDPQRDGVVIHYGSVPGGPLFPNDEGKVLVHEVGHWLGLFHTFQLNPNLNDFRYRVLRRFVGDRVNCWYNTDEVQDTPKQRYPTRGCPTGKDTCAMDPGLDPIHNFMDYSVDA
jgi:hypothetical protein